LHGGYVAEVQTDFIKNSYELTPISQGFIYTEINDKEMPQRRENIPAMGNSAASNKYRSDGRSQGGSSNGRN
jgi:hypothetical protein